MGPGGAVVIAALVALVGGVGSLLVVITWRGTRQIPRSPFATTTRLLSLQGPAMLILGVVLPKSTLATLNFEASGRWLMLALALVGGTAALRMVAEREVGGGRALITHLCFALVAATPIGEAVFGAFAMM